MYQALFVIWHIDAWAKNGLETGMQNDATLLLAALCLGIVLTGIAMLVAKDADNDANIGANIGAKIWQRERLSLGLVYASFCVIISMPLIAVFAAGLYLFYVPLILVMLLVLPPAVYHYVVAKTAQQHLLPRPLLPVPWRDILLPLVACAVCIGFWFLPAHAKAMMFISGELPSGIAPATLALITFVLILCWLVASFGYLLACVARLREHRHYIRQHYSNVDKRDLRWIDWAVVMLVVLWGAAAASVVAENLGDGALFPNEVLYVLTAAFLLFLTVFASKAPQVPEQTSDPTLAPTPEAEQVELPDSKYARSALSQDHAAKLAARIEMAMDKDALYLDPNLSLQKLSRHVGSPPNLVSQTLNEAIGSSFFDYVAHWRIKASKQLLLDSNASVLTVAIDVGFNSRSTFYKAFKRETGLTPNAFRDR